MGPGDLRPSTLPLVHVDTPTILSRVSFKSEHQRGTVREPRCDKHLHTGRHPAEEVGIVSYICTMLDQRRAGVAQMLYKCFVFAGVLISYLSLFYFHNYQTDRYIICVIDIKKII